MTKFNLVLICLGIVTDLRDFAMAITPGVFITIAANATVNLNNTIFSPQIQLNWNNATPQSGDLVGLFTKEPTNNVTDPLYTHEVNSSDGLIWTNISMSLPQVKLPLEKSCLGYWIAYINGDNVITSNCFKNQPNWMWENYDDIYNKSLSELMLPGTHDSGSFQYFEGWESENLVNKYTITQRNDFWNQLSHGIRYFDIRIAYYENEFWLSHSTLRVNHFNTQLKNLTFFINLTKEIVIIDFHSFETGFTNLNGSDNINVHNKLTSYLMDELQDVAIPRYFGYNVTLKTLWETNKRVLIGYNNDYYKNNEYLWPGIYQAWPNTLNAITLLQYFNDFMNKPIEYKLWSAQAEFTANERSMIRDRREGLREKADEVNPVVTKYFRDWWWDKANVVSTDFFMGNNIIDVCIGSNKKRNSAYKTPKE